VVVDDVEDLDVVVAGERDVGDVHLPAFVGQVGFEAGVGAAGPLVGLGGDKAAGAKHSPDGGDRRGGVVALGEVMVDRDRAGVEAVLGEVFAQGDDLVFEVVGDPGR